MGRDITWKDWQHFVVQLINQGYCEIAFHKHNALKLTEFSKYVLFNGTKVALTKPVAVTDISVLENKRKTRTKSKKITSKNKPTANNLFERLRLLRYKIAKEEDIPAYLVFSDATLREIERERPLSDDDFLKISGVGQRKMEVYGDEFIAEIMSFMGSKIKKTKKKDTVLVTYDMYKTGLSVEEISIKRKLAPTTIYSHIAKLYSKGKAIDIFDFVSKSEVEAVRKAKIKLDSPTALRPYFEYFNDDMDYFKIRLALSVVNKN